MDAAASMQMSGLVARVKGILMKPRAEWEVIEREPATVAGLYRGYVLPLAAIGPVATLIGTAVFGVTLPFVGAIRTPIGSALAGAVVSYALTLIGVYVMGLIINALAPTFGGRQDPIAALKVAVYASTATWIAGIFAIFPVLGVLQILGLYSLYLVYLGLPALMKAPAGRALTYTAAVVVVQIIISVVIGLVAAAVVGF